MNNAVNWWQSMDSWLGYNAVDLQLLSNDALTVHIVLTITLILCKYAKITTPTLTLRYSTTI
jgi:hypothetical protein